MSVERYFCRDKKDFCSTLNCKNCGFANRSGVISGVYADDVLSTLLGKDYNLDRLKKLIEADREGRCVVLPVKEGETVYHINWNPFEDDPPEIFDCPFHITDYYNIGNTIFLSEEEAESALEAMEGREKDV